METFRYQYDPNAPGAASQLRFTSTKDLNLNISVSNANMIIQAYASWNNLSDIHQRLVIFYNCLICCGSTLLVSAGCVYGVDMNVFFLIFYLFHFFNFPFILIFGSENF